MTINSQHVLSRKTQSKKVQVSIVRFSNYVREIVVLHHLKFHKKSPIITALRHTRRESSEMAAII